MPRAYRHRLAAYIPLFSKIPRLSVFSGLKTHKHPTPTTYTQPWSGPVDDVNWRVAPVYLSCSLRLLGLGSKKRGRASICSPSSIEYRYSPSVSPSSPFSPFSFSKNSVGFVFLFSCALRHHMPSFPSPRLSIRSLLRQRNLLPARTHMHIVSYRTIFHTYISLLQRGCRTSLHKLSNCGICMTCETYFIILIVHSTCSMHTRDFPDGRLLDPPSLSVSP